MKQTALARGGYRRAALVSLLAGTCLTPMAHATGLNWLNQFGGLAGDANNWSPSQIPTSADDLTFNLNASYTVSYVGGPATSRTHTYRRGTVTFVSSATHTISTALTVGSVSGDDAALRVTTGALRCSGAVIVADGSGSAGVLTVDDDDASFTTTTTSGDLTIGNVGDGALNVLTAGRVTVSDTFTAAVNSASLVNILVDGAQASPLAHSLLDVNGAVQHRLGVAGDAHLTITHGGEANFAGDLVVGNSSTSVSDILVEGNQAGIGSMLTVAGDLLLGRNTTAGLAAGTGNLTINGSGVVNVGGNLILAGDADGSGGATLRMIVNSRLVTHTLIASAGTLDQSGGEIVIDGGQYVNNAGPLLLSDTSGNPVLRLRNSASSSVAGLPRAVVVGGPEVSASGELHIESGSDFLATVGDVVLGDDADDVGRLTVDGAGSTFSYSGINTLIVGNAGTGFLNVSNGGVVNGGPLIVGKLASSSGTLAVLGAGSRVSATEAYFGGTSSAPAGTALLQIGTGGELHVSGSGNALQTWPDASVLLGGGTLSTDGDMIIRGALALVNGTLIGNNISITDTAGVSASGVMDGKVLLVGSGSQINASGALALGRSTIVAAFSNAGVVNAGPHPVTILSRSNFATGNVTLAGGSLSSVQPATLNAGRTISGNGTIDLRLNNLGTVTASGAGLVFNKLLTGNGVSGTSVRFASGGGYTGHGAIAANLTADAGSVIEADGNILSLGSAGSAFGCTLNGTLNCKAFRVDLLDSNGVALGALTTATNGQIIQGTQLVLNAARVLSGHVTLATPIFFNFGVTEPGTETGEGVSSMSFTGNYQQSAGGTLNLDVSGASQFDRLIIVGSASLNGTLNVTLDPAFQPADGTEFFILQHSAGRTGVFATANLPPNWEIVYGTTSTKLIAHDPPSPCIADFNQDGGIDGADLQAFFDAWENQSDPRADVNQDGGIDGSDVGAFVALWETQTCP